MSHWPHCPEPDILFGKCVLLCGPIPPQGWSVTRHPNGSAKYVTPRSRDARAFHKKVIEFFKDESLRRYEHRKWSIRHHYNLGRRWKNEFYLWIWELKDAS
jgi:hypothetical protein